MYFPKRSLNCFSGLITSFFDGLVTFVDVASLLGLLVEALPTYLEFIIVGRSGGQLVDRL